MAAAIGAAFGFAGLVMLGAVETGEASVANPAVLTAAAVGGALTVIGGLSYQAARSVRARRSLPPVLYRGPSVILLLVLATVLATLAQLPFLGEVARLTTGAGDLSALATFVLLTSQQAALLLVAGVFVALPRALPGLPPLSGGRDWPLAVFMGIGWGIAAWIGVIVLSAVIASLLQGAGVSVEPGPAEQALDVLDPLIVVPAVVLLAPIAEEIFFRGVMLNAWSRQFGERRAIIGSSAVFAVIHLSLVTLLPIFLLGIALSIVYRRTGSLLAAIAMHAAFNAASTAIALLVRYDVIRLPA